MDVEDRSSSDTTRHINPDQSSDEDSASSISSEWLAALSDSDSGEREAEPAPDQRNLERCVDAARMFKLRRALGQLDHFHQQKEQDLLTASEQLMVCRQHMEELLEQRERLEEDMRSQKEAENSAAVFRARALHRRLCAELQSEEELESLLKATIHKHQLELCEVEVEQAKVSSLRQEVQEEERTFTLHKQQRATRRLQQERQASSNRRDKSRQTTESKQSSQRNSGSQKEEKKTTSTNSVRLMREAVLRARQEEEDRLKQSRELVENRRQAVRALQSNISASHSRAKAPRQRAQREEREQSGPWAGGAGPALEKPQKQRSKGREMYAKGVLLEEQHMKRKKKEQVEQARDVKRAAERDRLLDSHPSPPPGHPHVPSPLPQPPQAQTLQRSDGSRDSSRDSSSGSQDSSDAEEQQEDMSGDLQLPEFSGMWAHDYKKANKKPALVPSQSHQDQQVMPNENVNTTAKKAPSKDTRGPPFTSKPELVHFKDIEVKQVYKKKVILTNVGYSTNVCRFVGVSSPLNNFVTVSFEPPGSLSAGMSCELLVVFEAQVNEDLEGEIRFASASGPFSVPVRCSTKKCQMEVDHQCLDFGSHVVGHTVTRTITLSNRGALGSLFRLDLSDRACPDHSPSPLAIPAATPQEAGCDESQWDKEKTVESGEEHSESRDKLEAQPTAETEAFSDQPTTDSSHSVDSLKPADSSHSEDDTDSTCDVHFGSVTEGQIEPFQSVKLDIIFKPTIPGDTKLTFYIHFSDSSSSPIAVQVKALALGVPVWVSNPTIDLKICLWDQPYHHCICVHSRASTALKLMFEVCPELRKHMEVVPKSGFVQAQSSFKALLKFQPRSCLHEDAGGLFDPDTGVLEAPVEVHAAGQSLSFTVSAVLTSSDLSLDSSLLDFGSCSLLHAVQSSVRLTNLSLLPQDFGFYNVPEFMEVQPNDGFGTLLPQETLQIDLIFRPKKAKVYNFQLCCKTGLNRDLSLSCRGVGVRPPLELSHSAVQFGATAVGHSSSALVYVTNKERRTTPAQPRLFCFHLPRQSDVSVSSPTGCLMPGERCVVQLTFRPRLPEPELKQEGSDTITEAEEAPAESRERGVETSNEEKHADSLPLSQDPGQLTVACCVSDPIPQSPPEEPPSWSPINTLYLKLQCPVIQPPLVVISESGGNTVNFHHVTVGETAKQTCVVQNISEESLELSTSVLSVRGPFSVLNALRPLRPGQSHQLQLAFSPTQHSQYRERLELRSHRGALWLTLCGEGAVPEVTCSPSGPELGFGHVLLKDTSSHTIQLQNHSALEVGFRALLSSQAPPVPQGEGPQCTSRGQSAHQNMRPPLPLPGRCLHSSGSTPSSRCSAFSVVPAEGRLAAGESLDLRVCFQPKEEYEFYRDCLTVELSNQSVVCAMDLQGAACSRNIYVSGGDPLPLPPDSTRTPGTVWGTAEEPVPVLVTLKGPSCRGQRSPVVRELQVGCVRSTLPSKKSAEFLWENLGSVQQQGFSIEPSRGAVEPGSTRTISITWTPPSGYKPLEVLQSCVPLTLKADTVTVYSVTLMALVTSDP